MPLLMLVAFLAGSGFSLIGLSYRFGQSRQIAPIHIGVVLCAVATGWFTWRTWGMSLSSVPAIIWILAIANGAIQYVVFRFLASLLNKGPLSPPWCMSNLWFLPVVVYSWLLWHEPLGTWQLAAIASAIVCVLFASRAQTPQQGSARSIKASPLIYGLLLVGLLVSNGVLSTTVKDLGCRHLGPSDPRTLRDVYEGAYFLIFYASMGAFLLGGVLVSRCYPPRLGLTVVLGLAASAGSVVGMSALAACSPYPSAVWSTVAGMSGIALTSILSVVLFGEKPGLAWAGMLAFALLSVVLNAM